MATGSDAPRWRRRLVVGLVLAAAVGFALQVAADLATEARLREHGVEVVAEVVEVRNNRGFTGYDDTEVAFTVPSGREVRTEVATQRVDLPVIRVRYDPDHPHDAAAMEDPAPLWLEDTVLVAALCGVAALVGYGPRRRAWRDREGGRTGSDPLRPS